MQISSGTANEKQVRRLLTYVEVLCNCGEEYTYLRIRNTGYHGMCSRCGALEEIENVRGLDTKPESNTVR